MFFVLYWGVPLTAWAFVDALIRPASGFVRRKLTKPGWAAITGLAALIILWQGPMSFLGLPAVIAAIVSRRRPSGCKGLRRGNSW